MKTARFTTFEIGYDNGKGKGQEFTLVAIPSERATLAHAVEVFRDGVRADSERRHADIVVVRKQGFVIVDVE